MNRTNRHSDVRGAIDAGVCLKRSRVRPTGGRIVAGDGSFPAPRRRGSAYVMVLGCSMSVAIIGVTGITALRVERSQATRSGDFAQARMAAQSAIEIGFREMNQNASWRTAYTSGTWFSDRKMRNATCTLVGQDPGDNDLADSNTDNVILTGVGVAGAAKFSLSVTTTAVTPPLDALGTVLHATQIVVSSAKSIVGTGAPVSSNGDVTINMSGVITGDVDAALWVNAPLQVTGTVKAPVPMKPMPSAGVLDFYAALATTIPYQNNVNKALLGPGVNTLGAANANGVYYIDASAGNVSFTNVRLLGTLVIRGPGRTVQLKGPLFMEAYRADYPVIVTDANLELDMSSGNGALDEVSVGINLNPAGVPINGVVDADLVDSYPNEIRGLVHTRGSLSIVTPSKVKGVVIVEGTATVGGTLTVEHDPRLYDDPPQGYTKTPHMAVVDGSWRQVVE